VKRNCQWLVLSLCVGLAVNSIGGVEATARAGEAELTLDSTAGLLTQGLGSNRDASIIRSALRSSNDPDLAPIFAKLAASKSDTQVFAMVSLALLTKDPAKLDLDKLLHASDENLIGSALASLVDDKVISNDQLTTIMKSAPDNVQRVMAASELLNRNALPDTTPLKEFLADSKDVVRYYSAVSLLQSKAPADQTAGLAALKDLTEKHDLRGLPVQGLMLMRCQKEKITTAAPWIESLAKDSQIDAGLRFTAVSTLLALKESSGPALLSDLIAESKEIGQQVKLGLIAIQYGKQLKPAQIEHLQASKSELVRSIALIGRSAAEGADVTPEVVKMLQLGHPIILNWSLGYSDGLSPENKLTIRRALIEQSTIVDEQRSTDFERAAVAAERIANDNTAAGRQLLATCLKSDNHAIVESVLVGLLRSNLRDTAELILPVWEGLAKKVTTQGSANYAALLLAREGRTEPLHVLAGMVQGGTVQNIGFRALAGWYYAKITHQTTPLLQRVLAAATTTTTP